MILHKSVTCVAGIEFLSSIRYPTGDSRESRDEVDIIRRLDGRCILARED